MPKDDPVRTAYSAIDEIEKELATTVARFGIVKQSLAEQVDHPDDELTDATLEIDQNLKSLVFSIDGPIPSVNSELKHYLPKDRYVWATMKEWWRGQIANAIRLEGWCPTLSPACVFIQVGSGIDLDNIGIKTAIDALVRNRVIAGDKKGLLQCVHIEHSAIPASQIRVCVFEPDDEIQAATEVFRKRFVVKKNPDPQLTRSGDTGSFFGPPTTRL